MDLTPEKNEIGRLSRSNLGRRDTNSTSGGVGADQFHFFGGQVHDLFRKPSKKHIFSPLYVHCTPHNEPLGAPGLGQIVGRPRDSKSLPRAIGAPTSLENVVFGSDVLKSTDPPWSAAGAGRLMGPGKKFTP